MTRDQTRDQTKVHGKRSTACGRWLYATILAGVLALTFAGGRDLNGTPAWEAARPDYAWSFPEDHWAREGYKTEWWYFTGHLEGERGERFGYQFTFFRVGLSPEPPVGSAEWAARDLIMGHAALSVLPGGAAGVQGGRGLPEDAHPPLETAHRFSEVVYRASPLLGGFGRYPDAAIAWSRGPAGTEQPWKLTWNGEAFDFKMADGERQFSFQLSTRPMKPLIFQGPDGYSKKGEGATAASQYYSFTRLNTTGRVTVDGQTFAVRGESWMDKEFGSNQLTERQVGWDWFSLQLADGRELMLYVLRDKTGATDFARGTVIGTDGATAYLARTDFEIETLSRWRSPETGGSYPSDWRVRVPSADLDLRVRPILNAQENRSRLVPSLFYWEGAVEVLGVDGARLGRGFVEMTGYGTNSRPAI